MTTDAFEIDALKLYMGNPYVINDNIIISQPKIKDIVNYGEQSYYSMVSTLVAISSDMKSQLDSMGLDYEQVSDFEVFVMLVQALPKERTEILLGNVDLSKMHLFKNPQNDEIVLIDKESGIVIDRFLYERIVTYIRKMHGLKKKVERAKNAITKKILIEEDRKKKEQNKNVPYQSFLLPLISSVKVRQGYTLDYVNNMGIVELMSEIERLQIINNADALLHGLYGGMIDSKGIDKKNLNWMRDLNDDPKPNRQVEKPKK